MRRRRRRHLPARPALWVLLVGNVAAGLWFSPLTVMRQVRVDGIPRSLEPHVEAILKSVANEPCARVPARQVETRIQALPGIRHADLRRNVFGVATLNVRRMAPVATVQGSPGLYLSDRGEFFRAETAPVGLPVIEPPPGYGGPFLAIAANWESRSAAQACLLAAQNGLVKPGSGPQPVLRFEAGGSISMRMQEGAVIELGGSNLLAEKFAKLKELSARNPKLFVENSAINLVSPLRATYVPKSRQQ